MATITHINPDTMYRSPAFSQAVSVEGAARTIYVGCHNGIDATGALVSDDFGAQSEQALRNVIAALAAAGASQEDVVKLTIHIAQGQDVHVGYAAAQKVWGPHPTAITGVIVAGLALPGALVEIEAIAAVG